MAQKEAIFRIFAGSLGSYKSYHGLRMILETLKTGAVAFTNIPLHWERIKIYLEDEEGIIVEDSQLVEINYQDAKSFVDVLTRGRMGKPNRAIIDEAALHYDSSDRNIHDMTLNFLVHARKLHIDTIFIAHDFHEIQKKLRNKAQSVMWFRDLQKLKMLGVCLPFPFYTRVEVDARNPKLKYDSEFCYKDKRLYKLYTSHDTQSVEMACIADSPDIEVKRVYTPPSPLLRIVRLFTFLGIGYGISSLVACKTQTDETYDEIIENQTLESKPGPSLDKSIVTTAKDAETVKFYDSLQVFSMDGKTYFRVTFPDGRIINQDDELVDRISSSGTVWISGVPHYKTDFSEADQEFKEQGRTDADSGV